MLFSDTQVAFLLPDDKREDYFNWIDGLLATIKHSNVTEAWNVYNDPIIIADKEFITQHNWKVVESFMRKIGAKNITETLTTGDLSIGRSW